MSRLALVMAFLVVMPVGGAAHGRERARAKAPEPQLREAFKAAFGTQDNAVRSGKDFPYTYRPYRLLRMGETWVLLSKASSEQCHACSGSFAVHYLRADGRGFKVVGAWPEINDGSSFGEPPEVVVRQDLFNGPALVLSGGWSGQGCESEWADVVELTPDRPVVRAKTLRMEHRRVIDWTTGGDTWGRKLQGHIRPLERGRSFAIDYTGRRRLTVRYALGADGTYRIVGKDPHIPAC